MKIVVLAGGLSTERDVSLSSGKKIADALRRCGHKVCFVDLFLGLSSIPQDLDALFTTEQDSTGSVISETAPDIDSVIRSRKGGFSSRIGNGVLELCRAADITYLGLHGGDGENGKLQAFFDLMDIRYTGNDSFGCAVAMDKWVTKQMLLSAGVPTPKGMLLHRGDAVPEFPLPCVVKPNNGGSSIGISIAHDRDEFLAALEEAFRYEDVVLVEEYVRGRELTCGVMDGHAMPLVEIIPHNGFYDYAHKYQPGWTDEICPAPICAEDTARVQALAERACRALGLAVIARVDFLLAEDGSLYCLEANTLPGMTPTSLLPQEAAAQGVDYDALCNMIVNLSERKYNA